MNIEVAAIKLNPEGVEQSRLDTVCKKLKENGIEPCFFNNDLLKRANAYNAYPADVLMKKCDIVIALGGDGTILHAAKQAAMFNKPVLGINSGHLGFMAGLEANELELLSHLKSGDYITDSRMMLNIDFISNGETKRFYCVNDAVISRGSLSRMVDISISFGAKTEMEYSCDGVIAATPTGSTAYSLSAGGPVFDPSVSSILITPVCAHSFFARPLVLSPKTVVTITANIRKQSECYLTSDGEHLGMMKNGDKIVISQAENYHVDLIRIKNESFMDVIYNKMVDVK